MPWKSLLVETKSDRLEHLETLFWDTGAVSVTVADAEDNPIFEPGPGEIPVWQDVKATALYEEDVDMTAVTAGLEQAEFRVQSIEHIEDKAWEREWLSRFKPMLFGKRLWVCPTGFEVDAEDAVIMDLDPGLAFGTGTHGTTRMCLAWLDRHVKPGCSVIDYGCGSGILGIGALLLGANDVIGLDNDPQALLATNSNAERNHVLEKIQTCLPHELRPKKFDLVIANILAKPLIDLSAKLIDLLADDGDIVLSGIMESQADWVADAYPMKLISKTVDDGWVCLHLRRSGER